MKINQPFMWLAFAVFPVLVSGADLNEPGVVTDKRINVRGQPSLFGEVITQLQKGEKVTILEEITLAKPKTNEPPKWFRIQMPANTPVWISASFIDPGSKTVVAPRLNLRAGPGENYSVVGRLEKGAVVKDIRTQESWMEIETPPAAYAFVAADLIARTSSNAPPPALEKQTNAPTVPPESVPTPATAKTIETPAKVEPASEAKPDLLQKTPPPITQPSTNVVIAPPPAIDSIAPKTNAAPTQAEATAPPTKGVNATLEPLPKRIVRREGIVRSTKSIQAPTYFELVNPETRKVINYLHVEDVGLSLKDFKGKRIIVTGEESIDSRWPKTPLIEIETLDLAP